jgi:phage-related protein
MGKYGGDDIWWLALGIGTIYAVTQFTKPLNKVLTDVGSSVGGLSADINKIGDTTTTAVDSGITGVSGIANQGINAVSKAIGAGEDLVSSATQYVSNGVSSFLTGVSEVINPASSVNAAATLPQKSAPLNASSLQNNSKVLDIALGTTQIQSVLGQSILPSFANNTSPGGNNAVSYLSDAPITLTNGLNNAQLANQMIAASSSNNSHTTNSVTTPGSPLVITTTSVNTGRTITLVRSSVLTPKQANGKRYVAGTKF